MSGLFGSLNSATSGLKTTQTALQTVSHNVSNANTEGYTRQQVKITANNPYYQAGVGYLGTGAKVSGIVRVVDEAVTEQLRNENANLNKYSQKSDALSQLESVFDELSGTGLSTDISNVFSSWTYLSSNPELTSAKTTVVQHSETLADTLNHMATQIESLQQATIKDIQTGVKDFNTKIDQLNTLNGQIAHAVSSGETPNDLYDKQDQLLFELAGVADVTVQIDDLHRASVSVDGEDILTKSGSQQLAASSSGAISVVHEDGTSKEMTLKAGTIKGNQEALAIMDEQTQSLNDFAYTFATAVNTVHGDGDETNQPIFDLGGTTEYAKNISVSKILSEKPELIHAGKDIEHPTDGDGTRAQAIAALQHTTLTYPASDLKYDSDKMSIENQQEGSSVTNRYNTIVTELGIVANQANSNAESQSDLVQLLNQRRTSVSGVSINEEVTNMIQYQSAFQANSRMISTIAEMLDTLINRTGV
ncbi:flagellar hook-associated protein FlgK [Pisciglobus halotolerans]|uniref:Flagellar hook-associated protein 1 n=1 Tax=Pisciglobus halotolerans TaxID=745365 RepID=A0A1I3ANL4_9LACT|nr:flagellar hook-associated protein FlgK [Pisciglobus halotolerans]SFH51614.1 flagellar hook-associated protein 1 FlgK [Pisciglobus halotolerans]